MEKVYRNLGIGMLVACLLLFAVDLLKFLGTAVLFPDFYAHLSPIVGQYGTFLFYLFMSLYTLLALWGIVLSIILIKNNSHNNQLLWWIYFLIGIKTLSFVLFLPLQNYQIIDLAEAILVYTFLVYQDNKWSRIIKNKAV